MSEIQSVKNRESQRNIVTMAPTVDVIEDAKGITLYADLPGVAKDKLGLRVEQDTLIIEGDIDAIVAQGSNAKHVEVEVAHYHRVFTLSKELDSEKISAQLSNGVLKLYIPKAEQVQPKRINVTVN